MELKRFLKTYRQILITGGVIVISLACLAVGVFPLAQKTLVLWNQISSAEADNKKLTEKSGVLQSLDEETLKSNLLALTSAVPADKSIGTIFSTMDGVAGIDVIVQDFQLTKVGSISTDSAKKLSADEAKTGAHIIPFSISVAGGYGQVTSFLTGIIAVRRLFSIRAIDIAFVGDLVTARINLDAYYTPLPTAIGGFTKPITTLSTKEEETLAKVSALPLQSSGIIAVGTASAGPSGKSDPFSP